MYMLTYESIDSPEECELEFDSLESAQAWVDKQENFLNWWDISDVNGYTVVNS